jgi:hypothetical protein
MCQIKLKYHTYEPENGDEHNDSKLIKSLLADIDIEVDIKTAASLWKKNSDNNDSGWLFLPSDDESIRNVMKSVIRDLI